MSAFNLCRLCLETSYDIKSLYDETGRGNELYDITTNYFHPMILNLTMAKDVRGICLNCWRQIWDFHNFRQSVIDIQSKLEDEDLITGIKRDVDKESAETESIAYLEVKDVVASRETGLFSNAVIKIEDGLKELASESLVAPKGGGILEGSIVASKDGGLFRSEAIKIEDEFEALTSESPEVKERGLFNTAVIKIEDEFEAEASESLLASTEGGLIRSEAIKIENEADELPSEVKERELFSTAVIKIEVESEELASESLMPTKQEGLVEALASASLVAQKEEGLLEPEAIKVENECEELATESPEAKDGMLFSTAELKLVDELSSESIEPKDRVLFRVAEIKVEDEPEDRQSQGNDEEYPHQFPRHWQETKTDHDPVTGENSRLLTTPTVFYMPKEGHNFVPDQQIATDNIGPISHDYDLSSRTNQNGTSNIEENQQVSESNQIIVDDRVLISKKSTLSLKRFCHSDTDLDRHRSNQDRQSNVFVTEGLPNFTCFVCSENWKTFSLLREHFRLHHYAMEFYFSCCKTRYYNEKEFHEHLPYHKDRSAFKCEFCGHCYKNRRSLTQHTIRVHPQTRLFQEHICQTCHKGFETKRGLLFHYRTCRSLTALKCNVCGFNTKSQKVLKFHRWNKHERAPKLMCPNCSRMFRGKCELNNHMLLHSDSNRGGHACPNCPMIFEQLHEFQRHRKEATCPVSEKERRLIETNPSHEINKNPMSVLKNAKPVDECKDLQIEKSQEPKPYGKYAKAFFDNRLNNAQKPDIYKALPGPISQNSLRDLPLTASSAEAYQPKKIRYDNSYEKIENLIASWIPSLLCPICFQSYRKYSLLDQHFHIKHPQEKCYIYCNRCNCKLNGLRSIESHVLLHLMYGRDKDS